MERKRSIADRSLARISPSNNLKRPGAGLFVDYHRELNRTYQRHDFTMRIGQGASANKAAALLPKDHSLDRWKKRSEDTRTQDNPRQKLAQNGWLAHALHPLAQ